MTSFDSSPARDERGGKREPRAEQAASWADHFLQVDHIAVAVQNLEAAERWFTEVLGFCCVERRELAGTKSGMRSAVMQAGSLVFVLVQGTNPDSQVSRFIRHYGQGVQHVALRVHNIDKIVPALRERKLEFSTSLIQSGELRQAFTRRNRETGIMLELVERGTFGGFSDENVSSLFRQLEESDEF